jgi:hypothetical protein
MTASIYDLLNPGNQPTASVVNTTDAVTLSQSGTLVQSTISQISAEITSSIKPTQYTFTATAGQTSWTPPGGVTFVPGTVDVYVNGARWNRTESYLDSSGTVVTFVNPLLAGYSVAIEIGVAGSSQFATIGSGAPSSTPLIPGLFYVDTTNKKIYCSTGSSSSSDWTILN